MSLQRRLTLFFVAIVILPLALAAFMVQRVVVGEVTRRAETALSPALDSTTVLYNERSALSDQLVRDAVNDARFAEVLRNGDRPVVDSFLLSAVENSQGVDFLVAIDKDGDVVGFASRPGKFLEGFRTPGASAIVDTNCCAGSGFNRTPEIEIKPNPNGRRIGGVIGGFWLDEDLLIASPEDVELSIAAGKRLIASTAPISKSVSIEPRFHKAFSLNLSGKATAEAQRLVGDMALIASTPIAPIETLSRQVQMTMLALLVVALAGTSVLAYFLARGITQPLEDLSEGAKAISEGRLDHTIKVRSRDEVGHLADMFNDMTARLRDTINELSFSRDQLHRTIRSVGETIRSTNDMSQMLQSIMNTAAEALQADAAVLWMFTSTREELYPAFVKGVEGWAPERVKVGQGVVGLVAERARGLNLAGGPGDPHPSRGEPKLPVVIAAPLYSQDRLHAVLATYRGHETRSFSDTDLDTLHFLAEQMGVAIENVSLHEEAQRLSLTDGLTGVFNRRFFQMQFRQVLATAQRFQRPFSVLMLDLDHFKKVNDTFGHQRGDEILIEFARRVKHVLREVDTFARYGGEEFICLLSETDLYGAMTTSEKILEEIRNEPFGSANQEGIQLTVSVGVASHPEHGNSFRALVEAADQALYAAKQTGRNKAVSAGDAGSPPLKLAR